QLCHRIASVEKKKEKRKNSARTMCLPLRKKKKKKTPLELCTCLCGKKKEKTPLELCTCLCGKKKEKTPLELCTCHAMAHGVCFPFVFPLPLPPGPPHQLLQSMHARPNPFICWPLAMLAKKSAGPLPPCAHLF
ncbi:unnamed protein product, partial [Discosporangium mesarthrocarpum]